MRTTAAITAIAGYLPDYRLSNAELEQLVNTTDEWILDRTGISERRILKEGCTSDMGAAALKRLLEKRGIGPEEIDLVICATVTPDMMFPATANIIADKVGAKNAWGFDVEAACCSLLFAFATAAMYVETGRAKKVVVIGADKMSSITDYNDRNTCILFGDAGTAMLLEPNTEGYGLMDFKFYTDGSGRQHLHMKAGGSAKPPSLESVMAREHFVFQEGKPVFKAAVTGMAQATQAIMERNCLTADQIAYLVPHQANLRIINATAEWMGLSTDKVMINIQKYGNTTGATIPLCLIDWEDKLRAGDNLVLAAFGGGFTWGAAYLKWAYTA